MRLTVICQEVPLPAIHGGRVDMWRRLQAFARLGVELQIISWSYEPPSESVVGEIRRVASSFINHLIERRPGYRFKRLPRILEGSLYAGLRWPDQARRREIDAAVKAFAPDCLWLDGFHGGLLALDLERRLGLPFFYRSQNVEHLYLDRLRRSASTLRSRLALTAGRVRLQGFERRLIDAALCTYDISLDDMAYWQRQGAGDVRWLPPLLDWSGRCFEEVPTGEWACDVLFLGNLNTENNIFALRWFLEEVVPSLLRALPQCRIRIAGSNPAPAVRAMCGRNEAVSLLINPEDATALLRTARVLVNPAQSGSGVNLKSLDMLAVRRPVVSTSQGVAGLPPEVRRYFAVCDTPDAFAEAVVRLHQGEGWQPPDTEWLGREFGLARIERLVAEMREVLKTRGRR